jgi:hypothetical protein
MLFMRAYFFILVLALVGLNLSLCQERKPASLVVRANEVVTDSVHVAPPGAVTDVYFNFMYKDKTPEVIMEIVARHILKQVIILGETNAAEGVVVGVLVNSNNISAGLVLSFGTREEAEKARDCLRQEIKP